jgi:hypothetical protein
MGMRRPVTGSLARLFVVGLAASLLVVPARGEAALTSDPLTNPPGWIAESNQAYSDFGNSVASGGDVNGDGYDDVIVGAPSFDNGQENEGRAYVYHGSATRPSLTPDWTAESDQPKANYAGSVAGAGDVNGDGYDDVIVGAHTYDNEHGDEGRAYVYHGSADGLSLTANWIAESDQNAARFGSAVGGAGDVNGDGYDDVIVGAEFYDHGQTNEGGAFAFYGSADGLSTTANWTAESNRGSVNFGSAVAGAGDVNGDGYDDVIVGADQYDNGQAFEGRAFAYHGSATGLSATANWMDESNQEFADFGNSVAGAGDVNADGFDDVIVGAHGHGDGGRAFAYHGSAAGLSASPNWTAEPNQEGASFGRSVVGAGDVNGDGYDDVIVGADDYGNDQPYEGRTLSYCGSATGLKRRACAGSESNQAYAQFGWSVAGAGDVNGDGFGDAIVGAWGYDHGQDGEGRAFAYFGRAG